MNKLNKLALIALSSALLMASDISYAQSLRNKLPSVEVNLGVLSNLQPTPVVPQIAQVKPKEVKKAQAKPKKEQPQKQQPQKQQPQKQQPKKELAKKEQPKKEQPKKEQKTKEPQDKLANLKAPVPQAKPESKEDEFVKLMIAEAEKKKQEEEKIKVINENLPALPQAEIKEDKKFVPLDIVQNELPPLHPVSEAKQEDDAIAKALIKKDQEQIRSPLLITPEPKPAQEVESNKIEAKEETKEETKESAKQEIKQEIKEDNQEEVAFVSKEIPSVKEWEQIPQPKADPAPFVIDLKQPPIDEVKPDEIKAEEKKPEEVKQQEEVTQTEEEMPPLTPLPPMPDLIIIEDKTERKEPIILPDVPEFPPSDDGEIVDMIDLQDPPPLPPIVDEPLESKAELTPKIDLAPKIEAPAIIAETQPEKQKLDISEIVDAKEPDKEIVNQLPPLTPLATIENEPEIIQEAPKEKKGFFARIFGSDDEEKQEIVTSDLPPPPPMPNADSVKIAIPAPPPPPPPPMFENIKPKEEIVEVAPVPMPEKKMLMAGDLTPEKQSVEKKIVNIKDFFAEGEEQVASADNKDLPPLVIKQEDDKEPAKIPMPSKANATVANAFHAIEFSGRETEISKVQADGLLSKLQGLKKEGVSVKLYGYCDLPELTVSKRISMSRIRSVRSVVIESGFSPMDIEIFAIGNTSEGNPNRVDIIVE